MSKERIVLEKTVSTALSGQGAHVEARRVLEGLDWKTAGSKPRGISHSVFQLTNHMVYWQEWVVRWFDGKKTPIPKHASGSWPGRVSPATAEEWKQTVRRFKSGLAQLDQRSRECDLFSKRGRKSRLEMLQTIALHNSYHIGQVAQLRQLLGVWPPPSGGVTW